MKNVNVKARFGKVLAGVATVCAGLAANAAYALDTTAIGTSITGAQTDGETVGMMVAGAVAGLVVIGVIISMVKKM